MWPIACPVEAEYFSNSQFNNVAPAASEVKMKSHGTVTAIDGCVHVCCTLPPFPVVAKLALVSANVIGKSLCAVTATPLFTVMVRRDAYPLENWPATGAA